jgi:hypothetical protein
MSTTLQTEPPAQKTEDLASLIAATFAKGREDHASRTKAFALLKQQFEAAQEQLGYREFGESLLQDLLRTPTMRDAGKYGRAVWLADAGWNPIYLIGSPQTCTEPWENAIGRATQRETGCTHGPEVRVIRVVTYQQTYDSPEGDTWRAEYLLLCPECLTARAPKEQPAREEDHRFM